MEPRLSAHACKHFREALWRLPLTLYPSVGVLTCLLLRHVVVAVKYSNCDTNNNRHYDVPTIGHILSYKRCVHRHPTLLLIDSILCSSPDRLQLGGHDSREGDGPLWQTGVGLLCLSLHRDVRTSVYWLFYTGRIYRRARWRSDVCFLHRNSECMRRHVNVSDTWCRPTAIDDDDDGRPPSQRARVHTGREATRRRTTDDSEFNVREPPTTKAPAEVALEASDRGVRRKRRRRVCMRKRVFASPYNEYVVVKHKRRKWRRGLRGGKTMIFT